MTQPVTVSDNDPRLIARGDEEKGAVYLKSTQQLDLEERLARERGEVPPADEGRDFSGGAPQEELDAYVGVDPIYRNHANSERDQPRFAEEGSAEAEFEKRLVDGSDMILVGVPQDYADAREEREAEVAEHNERHARGEVTSHVEMAPVTSVTARESESGEGPSQADSEGTAPERAARTEVTDDKKAGAGKDS